MEPTGIEPRFGPSLGAFCGRCGPSKEIASKPLWNASTTRDAGKLGLRNGLLECCL
jgi:hypothetical protein